MKKEEIITRALEEYNRCLNDGTFVDRQEAAINAAINSVTADVWNKHGIKSPVETIGRADIRAEISTIIKEMRI